MMNITIQDNLPAILPDEELPLLTLPLLFLILSLILFFPFLVPLLPINDGITFLLVGMSIFFFFLFLMRMQKITGLIRFPKKYKEKCCSIHLPDAGKPKEAIEIPLGVNEKGETVSIPFKTLLKQGFQNGMTGSGKTAALRNTVVESSIKLGCPVFYFNVKPREAHSRQLRYLLEKYDRGDDFRILDFFHPSQSHTCNVMSRGNSEVKRGRLLDLLPETAGDSNHYRDMQKDALRLMIQAMEELKESFNILDIIHLLSHLDAMNELCFRVENQDIRRQFSDFILGYRHEKSATGYNDARYKEDMKGLVNILNRFTVADRDNRIIDIVNCYQGECVTHFYIALLAFAELALLLKMTYAFFASCSAHSLFSSSLISVNPSIPLGSKP